MIVHLALVLGRSEWRRELFIVSEVESTSRHDFVVSREIEGSERADSCREGWNKSKLFI